MLRYFISFILFSPIFVGLNAYVSSILSVCHKDFEKIEPRRKELALIHTDAMNRFSTLKNWFEAATRDEIAKIWGEPILNEDTAIWVVPLEAVTIVSAESYEENGNTCFTQANSNRVLIVEETIKLGAKETRNFRIIGGMESSTAIANRLKREAE